MVLLPVLLPAALLFLAAVFLRAVPADEEDRLVPVAGFRVPVFFLPVCDFAII